MKRIMLTVAYDGTNYCGWQLQPNGNTIQAELEKALRSLLGEEIRIHGASRTDAGVHAKGNVAVFDTSSRMDPARYAFALNTWLPEDIRVQGSAEVPALFHPRFCASAKTYAYRICNRTFPDPSCRLYSLFWHYPLDAEKMNEAAGYLTGEHDFTSFCTMQPHVTNRVRTIYESAVTREGDMITYRVRGSGFLYNMVRIIAGTLIRAGGGMLDPSEMPRILEGRDRLLAGDTARACGLTLERIEFL